MDGAAKERGSQKSIKINRQASSGVVVGAKEGRSPWCLAETERMRNITINLVFRATVRPGLLANDVSEGGGGGGRASR